MSRPLALLAVLTSEPTSTSELYEHIGYATLIRLGLIPDDAFRAELVRLSLAGLATTDTGRGGATTWRLAAPSSNRPHDRSTPQVP